MSASPIQKGRNFDCRMITSRKDDCVLRITNVKEGGAQHRIRVLNSAWIHCGKPVEYSAFGVMDRARWKGAGLFLHNIIGDFFYKNHVGTKGEYAREVTSIVSTDGQCCKVKIACL